MITLKDIYHPERVVVIRKQADGKFIITFQDDRVYGYIVVDEPKLDRVTT